MLSPYEISEIKNVNAYTIDNKLYDLILVKNGQLVNSGSVFENPTVLRSIINRFIENPELSNLLFENNSKDKEICYLIEYASEKKFLIVFNFSEIGLNNVEHALQFIKSMQEDIKKWFIAQIDSKRNMIIEDFRIFPRYDTPDINALISLEDKLVDTRVQNVSLFAIVHKANEEIEFEFKKINSINLVLGSNNYNLKVLSTKLMKKDLYLSQLIFEQVKPFNLWLQFIIAMQLRYKKSLQTK